MEKNINFIKAKSNRGITLIALAITIGVLIILSFISISSLTSDNGIIKQTNVAKIEKIEGDAREQVGIGLTTINLAILEARGRDNSFSAIANSGKIKAELIKTLNSDKIGLDGEFTNAGIEEGDNVQEIKIAYTGNDYKTACNDLNAQIIYTLTLTQRAIEFTEEKNSTLKDQNQNDFEINLLPEPAAGLYQTGSNYKVLIKDWNSLVSEGILNENGSVKSGQSANLAGDLILPNTLTTIVSRSFASCQNLTSVKIPEGVTSISNDAFYYCTVLTSVEIPNSVTSIEEYAFYNAKSLSSIEIPEGVVSIGSYAFQCASNLESIKLPSTLQSIGNVAFNQCTSLTNIEIPEGVTNIGKETFSSCTNLKSVKLPSTLTTIDKSTFASCSSLESIEIPNGVTNIGESAFSWCESLTNVTMGDSVTTIGNNAFINCTNLINIKFSNNLSSIGESAFSYCKKIQNIEIPSKVTSIGKNTFDFCNKLSNIKILAVEPPTVGQNIFNNCFELTTIIVPKGSLNAYKTAANWSSYASMISEEE